MIRTLLTTSAIALVLSTAAIAQTTTTDPAAPATTEAPATDSMAPADPAAPATDSMAPADTTTEPATDSMAPATDTTTTAPAAGTDAAVMANEPWDISAGYTIGSDDVIASAVLGAPVYSSTGDDAEEIGTINDLVLSPEGNIHAVVIGVGGFLGIGEKNVAADFASLEHSMAADNTWRWVLPTTSEALEAAPDFVWTDPNAPAAPAADPAMAPADPATPAVPQ